jgi:hypothetical protein
MISKGLAEVLGELGYTSTDFLRVVKSYGHARATASTGLA